MIRNKPYKLIIFDWDGTLVDSAGAIVNSVAQTIKTLNLPELDYELIRMGVAHGGSEYLYPYLFNTDQPSLEQKKQYLKTFYQHYHQTPKTNIFPGVSQLLAGLKELDYTIAIATNKKRKFFDLEASQLDLQKFFSITRCAGECLEKPNPEMLSEIITETQHNCSNTLMVGDSCADISAAYAAQVDVAVVTNGCNDIHKLTEQEPTITLPATYDLLSWLSSSKQTEIAK